MLSFKLNEVLRDLNSVLFVKLITGNTQSYYAFRPVDHDMN